MEKEELKAKIIEDFEQEYKGKMDDAFFKANLAAMKSSNESCHATGAICSSIASRIVTIDCCGYRFNGYAWGIGNIGTELLLGDINLAEGVSWDDLFKNTNHFWTALNSVYFCVIFYDGTRYLGAFHVAAISCSNVFFGGSGGWEKR